ncbi:DUF1800 family protein [Pseudoroseomonas cervicalis]|uniref:DUF1800 domain-containing protein n=1 Tax=Teichococcus cervicalis TaxID=204525 RepID=UPI0027849A10|nr:DUF1800 domain-containing protein [Pseudoroseomonas cervicalis]MDQ1079245.1 uncharacterized protein (DUF1800 family) [Pseudoroseomonas cervicalis]
MDTRSIHAAIRFGLGARPDQPLPSDPRAALLAELRQPDTPPPPPEGWDHPPTLSEVMAVWEEEDRMGREAVLAAGQNAPRAKLYRAENQAQAEHALTTSASFRERLVLFWANHFTVSRRTAGVFALTGEYLRSAIRPHVNGRLEDMVLAAERHPAMLLYLNQNSSIGPNSPSGQRSRRGLNENLAREILELHTVSPAAGYSQRDVTQFALLLTGLSLLRRGERAGTVFAASRHEPGEKRILGQRFGEGEAEIERALRFLAGHEATHRHVAEKLVRHFVADDPPPAAVRRVFSALRDSRGDLGVATAALIEAPEAWDRPLTKIRSPQDFTYAALRGLGAEARHANLAISVCGALGQPYWTAPAPKGWPDRAEDWVSPEMLLQRMERAHDMAGRFSRQDPAQLAEVALGPLARPQTLDAVRRAGSLRDGLTLLLASPEFQRR